MAKKTGLFSDCRRFKKCYRKSAVSGTERKNARKGDILDKVVEDLQKNNV